MVSSHDIPGSPGRTAPPVLPVGPDGAVRLGDDVRAVLLDIDGVLNDHRTAADAAAYAWASTLPGWSLGPRETAELWEALDRKHFTRYQHGELTYPEQLHARIRDFVPGAQDLDAEAAQARMDEYFAQYRARWVGYDDTADLIARLLSAVERRTAAGGVLRVAYVTNGNGVTQREKLEAIGALVDGWPVLASAQLGASKPDPRVFALACEALGVEPADAVMVGDDAWADVDGAAGAGLRCVHLRRSEDAPRRPVAAITTLRDLIID